LSPSISPALLNTSISTGNGSTSLTGLKNGICTSRRKVEIFWIPVAAADTERIVLFSDLYLFLDEMRPIVPSPNTMKKMAIHKHVIRTPLGKMLSVLPGMVNSALACTESGRVINNATL
jgi:hypothetical protein